jgi:beta-glucosidase
MGFLYGFFFYHLPYSISVTSKQTGAIPFPKGFWWGTSLAAHQVEGHNLNSWTRWEDSSGRIKNNDKSGSAIRHWELFNEDFDKLNWLNVNTHRLSIEWSRLESQKGEWQEDAVLQYRKMILALKERKIRPMICLFHFSLPLWMEDLGGFENLEGVEHFTRFVKRAVESFGDLVSDWLTMNEPAVYALGGYGAGLTPPGVQDLKRCLHVMINLMKAHGAAYHVIKGASSQNRVSFAHHLRAFSPRNILNPLDHIGVKLADEIFNWSWYQSIQTGKIQISIPGFFYFNETCPESLGAMDYLGFNYYSRDHLSLRPFSAQKFFPSTPPHVPKTDMGWEIYPEGLKIILRKIKSHGLGKYPLLVTENGIADAKDDRRSQFIYEHLKVFLEGCQEFDLKPMGYLYWAPFDNFEWIDGFGPRFGLFEVDYKTHERRPRGSAHYFKRLGQTQTLVPPS